MTMRRSLWVLFGISTAVSASGLATLTPCPSCPSGIAPSLVTVTAQYQPVSTCTPKKCSDKGCTVTPACQTYDYVSTVIPCNDGSSKTTITKTEDEVTLGHLSTVLTSKIPVACPTKAPYYNASAPAYGNGTAPKTDGCTSTQLHTLIVDEVCLYEEIGDFIISGYGGSGICKVCKEDEEGSKFQPVTVKNCYDGTCSTYVETRVSRKPVTDSSTSTGPVKTSATCTASGVNTIAVTATLSPTGAGYSQPVTTMFQITTSVPSPQEVQITKYVTVTYYAGGVPATAISSASTAVMSTSTYCPENGIHTIPMVTTCYPGDSHYTEPVVTTVQYTTTVTNAPCPVVPTTTITVTFTQTTCPVSTVTSTSPVTTTMGSFPTAPPMVGPCENNGCYGSTNEFSEFVLIESSGSMTIELCLNECQGGGFEFSGLHITDCYCAHSIDSGFVPGRNADCNAPCAGNHKQACGGGHQGSDHPSWGIYSCPLPSMTTTTTTETSTTTSSTPDVSSDPDVEPHSKGDYPADMQVNRIMGTRDVSSQMRKGGLLRNPAKREQGIVYGKRDFGLKMPFGR